MLGGETMTDTPNPDIPSRPLYMLTTVDNPFDPFTQWDEWYVWDQNAGYCTPGLLARVALLGDEISEADEHALLQQAIDEIVRENVTGMHKKVLKGEVQASTEE